MKKYNVPDFSKWNITKITTEKPKVRCCECKDSTWCVWAPYVHGCDDGTIINENV